MIRSFRQTPVRKITSEKTVTQRRDIHLTYLIKNSLWDMYQVH